jgi:hypothetical protein
MWAFLLLMICLYLKIGDECVQARRSDERKLSFEDKILFKGLIPPVSNSNSNARSISSNNSSYNFIHIPKTAGASFLVESPRHMSVGTTLQGNREKAFHGTPGLPKDMVILLRQPIKHCLSQFMECKHDEWGKVVTNGTAFPRTSENNNTDATDYDDFEVWVDHFLNHTEFGRSFAFHCYDPYNMQTRYLVKAKLVHFVHYETELEPSLDVAKSNLDSIGLVGISDYYEASVCLFEYHTLRGRLLPEYCTCQGSRLQLADKNMIRLTHNVPKHSIHDLNANLLQKVHRLVQMDLQLYDYALRRFRRQLEKVRMTTGVDLLCGKTLK